MSDLNVSEPGVCLFSRIVAAKELKGARPLAILWRTININNRAGELQVLMGDVCGRCVVRRRFLIQLGVGEVTYMDGKPKKQFKPESAKVVLNVAKHHVEADIWGFVRKHPREVINKWLEVRAKISFWT